MPAVYVPELRRASSRVLRPYGLASRRRPVDRTVEHADGYTSQTGTQLHISQTGVHTWDVHIADEARMIGSASIFALAPLALRRPLHGRHGARFARP